MLIKMIKGFFANSGEAIKYTCVCCGYKTLLSNSMGEICPICNWEEDYLNIDDFFEYSSANNSTLYEAQENYQAFGACQRRAAKRCGKPCNEDVKDDDWISSQMRIENLYNSKVKAKDEVESLVNKLLFSSAKEMYSNFKTLPEISIYDNDIFYENHWMDYSDEIYKNQLLLRALSIYLMKIEDLCLINLIISYYYQGLHYYIGWSIMLMVALDRRPPAIAEKLSDVLVDIEKNNFYGVNSLREAIEKYWLAQDEDKA